eukprot:TRINITY_DN1059_c0_g1_i18.p4 TRINITY_DN1059_c0_g1~~TRINITY_DN1059_c0_g1_i18.p4  ORF type:complete len:103 (-),score=4.15 TRINITY_DN1059_c0_g1_i18:347-655(-)
MVHTPDADNPFRLVHVLHTGGPLHGSSGRIVPPPEQRGVGQQCSLFQDTRSQRETAAEPQGNRVDPTRFNPQEGDRTGAAAVSPPSADVVPMTPQGPCTAMP